VQKAPAYADAWAMLAAMYTQDYGQGFQLRPDPLVAAETAARKAVELEPTNHLAWGALARVHFFQKQLQNLRNSVERAVTLNSMDGDNLAHFGELLTFSGDFKRGLELVERAKHLNPHHPGWYWYANFYEAYEQHDYRAALNFALKVNLPGHWAEPMLIAAACGQLGEFEAAAKAVADLLKLRPNIASRVRSDMQRWWRPDVVQHLIEGLRKAGLEITDDPSVNLVETMFPIARRHSTIDSDGTRRLRQNKTGNQTGGEAGATFFRRCVVCRSDSTY
jgi:tetratricopeptide (TPR) repeat protein